MKEVAYFYGGSFDPWHNGHSYQVSLLKERKDGRKILIAPSHNPWKAEGLIPLKQRIELVTKLYAHDPQVEVLTDGFPYTFEFMEKYSSKYDLVLVFGEDSFATYPQWKNHSLVESLIKGKVVVPRTPESSTAIRADLKSAYGQVPQGIYDYLLVNHINFLKPSLTADALVVNLEGKVLVMRRNTHPFKDTWVFPGGFVDPGENPQVTASRELEEETKIKDEGSKVFYVDTFGTLGRDLEGGLFRKLMLLN